MPFEIQESSRSLVSVKIKGILKKSELDQMQEVAAKAIEREGKIRILVILDNFLGWESGANWGDLSFNIKHDKDIEKIAIVGDEKWRDLALAFLAKPFRPMKIEYFDSSQLERARSWIT
ncbi:MAG TPA: STAS/SEC14 domain-containing protein [Thermodesulfobacteriota bacterium]|nr:STAS/SEC14 domain-containing protein [Thermodesulfobacteriota bacterium]